MVGLLIKNGTIITGDSKTLIAGGTVLITGSRIEAVSRRSTRVTRVQEIDAQGKVVIPGIINHHAHGITCGPLFPSAAEPLSRDQVKKNLGAHLLQGTTTILCVDGFTTKEEVEHASKLTSMTVKAATIHTPKNLAAADAVDGAGLRNSNRKETAKSRLAQGAPALGEVGAGSTLGGGCQDYKYIPEAVKCETGREIDARQAMELKYAVLGRHIKREGFNADKVKKVLKDVGLSSLLTVNKAREIVEESVLPPFDLALEGFEEAYGIAVQCNVPAIFHNAAATKDKILEIAQAAGQNTRLIIAAHSNHDTFSLEEAVKHAKRLKDLGVIIDIASFDCFINRFFGEPPDIFYALLEAGLCDTVSTDYCAGHYDSILTALHFSIKKGLLSLSQAIGLVTRNVVDAIPRLAPNKGLLSEGKIADVVIVDEENLAKVETVIIGGEVVVRAGEIVQMTKTKPRPQDKEPHERAKGHHSLGKGI